METCPNCGHQLKKSKVSRETYESIINYLNQKIGRKYKSTTPATQRLIKARFNEGFTENDFLKVIDNQARKWLSDPNMMDYLRPQTLFSTKFESYLQNGTAPKLKMKKIHAYDSMGAMKAAFWTINNRGYQEFVEVCEKRNMPKNDIDAVYFRHTGQHDSESVINRRIGRMFSGIGKIK